MNRLVIALFGVLFLLSGCKQNGESPVQTVDVMSFNIRLDEASDGVNNWKYRKDNVIKMVAYYEPDVVGMQEVCHNQMEDLKQGLPQYTAIGVGRDDGEEASEYCPIFFKSCSYSLLRSGNFVLSENPNFFGTKGWDASYNRIATWAILQEVKSGKKLAVFNTHLDNDGAIARKEGINLIVKKMEEFAPDMARVLTGDFNCTPSSEPLRVLQSAGMVNSLDAAQVIYGPSWSFHDFGRIEIESRPLIDYIYVTSDVKVTRFRMMDDGMEKEYLSDHSPLLVQFTF